MLTGHQVVAGDRPMDWDIGPSGIACVVTEQLALIGHSSSCKCE
jgi:hypothetical protein